jgi:hypothetical protein
VDQLESSSGESSAALVGLLRNRFLLTSEPHPT